jgi:hypothetical protein
MKFKNAPKTGRLLLAIGLLLTASSGIIKDFVYIPDFFCGVMMGFGSVLEIIGFILLRRKPDSICRNNDQAAIY